MVQLRFCPIPFFTLLYGTVEVLSHPSLYTIVWYSLHYCVVQLRFSPSPVFTQLYGTVEVLSHPQSLHYCVVQLRFSPMSSAYLLEMSSLSLSMSCRSSWILVTLYFRDWMLSPTGWASSGSRFIMPVKKKRVLMFIFMNIDRVGNFVE